MRAAHSQATHADVLLDYSDVTSSQNDRILCEFVHSLQSFMRGGLWQNNACIDPDAVCCRFICVSARQSQYRRDE